MPSKTTEQTILMVKPNITEHEVMLLKRKGGYICEYLGTYVNTPKNPIYRTINTDSCYVYS